MSLRLIASQNLNVGIINLDIKKGNYKDLVFEFVGTNNTGQTLAITDLGNLILSRDSVDFCNCDLQDLANKNNFEAGIDLASSTTSGAFNFALHYSFAKPYDKQNAVRFEATNGRIVINLGNNVGTKVLTGQLNVYGVFTKGVEKYLRKYLPFSQILGDVGSMLAIPLRQANVNALYFRTASDYQMINVLKDDYPILFGSGAALAGNTSYTGRIESAVTFIYEELNPTDTPAEITSNALQLNLTSAKSGGGNSVIMYEVIEFNPDKTAVSLASYQKFESQKLASNTPATQVQTVLTSGKSSLTSTTTNTIKSVGPNGVISNRPAY
jgi:hypothetical protein